MTRDQKASILADVIRLAREGNTQAAIARAIGTNPSRVYKICKNTASGQSICSARKRN